MNFFRLPVQLIIQNDTIAKDMKMAEKNLPEKTSQRNSHRRSANSCRIINMRIKANTVKPWYSGILNDEMFPSKDSFVKVKEKNGCIEFVLPGGTAQFNEVNILDNNGNIIWKKQSFNKNIIVWDKLTMSGGRVPQGEYIFRMKQGDYEIDAIALIDH